MKHETKIRPWREIAAQSHQISLSTQILSGIAAMIVTMGLMTVTLPPHDVADAGRIVLATAPSVDGAGASNPAGKAASRWVVKVRF